MDKGRRGVPRSYTGWWKWKERGRERREGNWKRRIGHEKTPLRNKFLITRLTIPSYCVAGRWEPERAMRECADGWLTGWVVIMNDNEWLRCCLSVSDCRGQRLRAVPCGAQDYDEMSDWVTAEWPLSGHWPLMTIKDWCRSRRPVDAQFDAVSLSVCLSLCVCVCVCIACPEGSAASVCCRISTLYTASAATRTVTTARIDLVLHLSLVVGTNCKIRHWWWWKLPVSVRADRWLRAGRHCRLIRVDATRSTPAASRHWYMT